MIKDHYVYTSRFIHLLLSFPLLIKRFSLPFCCIEGLSDENHLVQNAALFALGQYSEYLQVR